MEKTKIIYLRTENMVNYYINVKIISYIPVLHLIVTQPLGYNLPHFLEVLRQFWGLYLREIIFLKIQETI